MKILVFILLPFLCLSQVGIGTTNPQNDLDVNGGIRAILPIASDLYLVTQDSLGDFSKRPYTDLLTDAKQTEAHTETLRQVNTSQYFDFFDIQIKDTVIVPAGHYANIKIEYSVPIIIITDHWFPIVDLGARLYKNGIDILVPGRTRTLTVPNTGTPLYLKEFINGQYIDKIDNSGGLTDLVIIYSLWGHINQTYATGRGGKVSYFFGMKPPLMTGRGNLIITKEMYQ